MKRSKRMPLLFWFLKRKSNKIMDSSVVSSKTSDKDRTDNEGKTMSSFASACTSLSDLTTGKYKDCITDSIIARLSKFEQEDRVRKVYRSKIQKFVNAVISSFLFRIFEILLIFVDVSLVIKDMVITDTLQYLPMEQHSISFSIALFFLLDLLLRLYVNGIKIYFSDALNSIDAFIVLVALCLDSIYLFYDLKILKDIPRVPALFRLLRLLMLIRVFHLAYQKRQLEVVTRRLVSGNKRRYKKDGFDLDLTYITERIIAMSYPSSGQQSFYRNPIAEVIRFLDTKHPNHYLVYNLCSTYISKYFVAIDRKQTITGERAYDPKFFHYRVHRIRIEDHNVPMLRELLAFCKEVDEWLSENEENVIVVHCKGGKGRTGTMICAYLIVSDIFETAEESLYYFGERRTDKTSSSKYQGVETPSQHRYVEYIAALKNANNLNLPPKKVFLLKKIIIYAIHGVGKGNGSDLNVQIVIQQKVSDIYSSTKNMQLFHDVEADQVVMKPSSCPVLYDDVKIQFLSTSDLPKFYNDCPFFFWFHTSFVCSNRLYLPRNQLDNPHRPKTWKIYRENFAVELYLEESCNADLLNTLEEPTSYSMIPEVFDPDFL